MLIEQTAIPGAVKLTARRFADGRGYFAETWNRRRCTEAGIGLDFVQDNTSLSTRTGTLRGLHFQVPPHAQAKLVRCGRGALYDVVVDLRRGSPVYGRWIGVELTAENGCQLLVPQGCAHGFVTLLPDTEIAYKCSDYYAPECEGALRWDDPDLAIDWPLAGSDPVLSAKDEQAGSFADFDSPFVFEGAAR